MAAVLGGAASAAAASTPAALHHPPMMTANLPWWAIFVIVLVLVALVAAAVVVVKRARRMARGGQDISDAETFSLADLRRLRDAGLLSDTEYESLREAVRRHELQRQPPTGPKPRGKLR